MRDFVEFAMRSRFHAMTLAGIFGALSLSFLPLSFLSAACVALVALRRGSWEGVIAVTGAAGFVAIGWFFVQLRPGLGFPIVLAIWPTVLLAAAILRRTESQGTALLFVGSLCAVFVVVMHLLTADVVAFWLSWLQRAASGVPGATMEGFERDGTLRLMNGLIALMFGASSMSSLLLARWWQSSLYNPDGFAPEFRRLRLPRRVLVVVLAALWVGYYARPGLVMDLFLVSVMMYFFVGLAVVHGVVAMRRLPWSWTLPPYIVIALMPQHALIGLALCGAMDAFIDFRGRSRRG